MEQDDENYKEFLTDDKYYGLILPDNARVKEKLQQRAAEEAKIKAEETRKLRNAEEKTKKKNMQLKKDEEERERRRREKELDEQTMEKYEESIKEGGNLNEIFSTILRNTSAYELAFPNYNMEDGWNFRLLTTILERNTSLLTLSLSRKNLGDVEGAKLADMLKKNQKLRRLELEGNFLGPSSAKAFGAALEVNKTLRYLDLENNNLTNGGKDISGIIELCDKLEKNKMLISLNIANNHLTSELGGYIVKMIRTNHIIINLEFFQNKEYSENSLRNEEDSRYKATGLSLGQIKDIKDALKKNNEDYNKMRTAEWKERKRMTNNYQDNVDTQIIVEASRNLADTRKKEKEDIENLYLEHYNESIKGMEEEFNQKVNEFLAETKARLEKKKPKKKKKKK